MNVRRRGSPHTDGGLLNDEYESEAKIMRNGLQGGGRGGAGRADGRTTGRKPFARVAAASRGSVDGRLLLHGALAAAMTLSLVVSMLAMSGCYRRVIKREGFTSNREPVYEANSPEPGTPWFPWFRDGDD